MNDKNTYSVDKYLEIIAEKEGITKEEVQQEIGRAVSIALKSPDLNITVRRSRQSGVARATCPD